jgi:2-(3-amino-3-carboxypropyl)histidine synthase
VSSSFDLEEKRLVNEVQRRKANLVIIQLPEGLKPEGPRLASLIEEKTEALAIIMADPCYGACDLALVEAESLGADMIVHYGHSEMLQTSSSTLYIEAESKKDVKTAIKKAVPLLKPWKNIGLVTTVQHIHKLGQVKELLLKSGKAPMVGDSGRLKYAGQVVGCDYSNAKAISNEVDAYLFIGGGKFHAIGVALSTSKPTIVADPYERKAFPIQYKTANILKKRWASIHEAKLAERMGILVGLKTGQKRLEKAIELKRIADDLRKKTTLLAVTEITPEVLMQFPSIDAFVNTACPRVSLDDSGRFRKPLLTPREMLVALDQLNWEELCKEGWFEN